MKAIVLLQALLLIWTLDGILWAEAAAKVPKKSLDLDAIPKKNVHFFYYIWYGTPEHDGGWKHWDHEVLPHWTEAVNKNFPTVGQHHSPPGVIHSPFYPLRNPYSSRDPAVIIEQFEDMLAAGGNVAVMSWWGQASKPYSTDTQGVCTDKIIEEILNVADSFGKIKIAFHLEPYPSRTVESVREDVEYILSKYGNHSSIYRARDGRPLFYVYDSYHIFPSQWRRLLRADGDITVRGTPLDAYFIALWLDRLHGRDAEEGGFDGIYTYFATDGFSYGSTSSNWKSMCDYCRSVGMLCILSVGPGYDDTSIRPWNAHNVRDRRDGMYYEEMWQRAINADPTQVSITSFNEWGEGTQIEAARAVSELENYNKTYQHYGDRGPFKYLHITHRYASILKSSGQTIHQRQSRHHERSVREAAGLPSDDKENDDEYVKEGARSVTTDTLNNATFQDDDIDVDEKQESVATEDSTVSGEVLTLSEDEEALMDDGSPSLILEEEKQQIKGDYVQSDASTDNQYELDSEVGDFPLSHTVSLTALEDGDLVAPAVGHASEIDVETAAAGPNAESDLRNHNGEKRTMLDTEFGNVTNNFVGDETPAAAHNRSQEAHILEDAII